MQHPKLKPKNHPRLSNAVFEFKEIFIGIFFRPLCPNSLQVNAFMLFELFEGLNLYRVNFKSSDSNHQDQN